ncbi:MAG: hypothetical protein RIF41_35905, partial [Polyangiaceae bacterium]
MSLRGALFMALLAACVASGCKNDESVEAEPASTSSPTSEETAAPTGKQVDPAWAACASRRDEAKKKEAVPGAADFEKNRLHMSRVRGQSLLWRRVPGKRSERLQDVRDRNDAYDKLVVGVRGAIRKLKKRDARREHLLREGYLYDDDVGLALALVEQVSLPKLFEGESLFIQRGADIYELKFAKRTRFKKNRYVYVDGPWAGEKAEVLLGDRVAETREELPFDADTHPSNGSLRNAWKRAYFNGWRKFNSQGELREVYTPRGHALA